MLEFNRVHVATAREIAIVDANPLIYTEADAEIAEHLGPARLADSLAAGEYVNLRYGFEFHPGWLDIVERMSAKLSTMVELVRLREAADPTQFYIHGYIFKEKFGCLTWEGNVNVPPYAMGIVYDITDGARLLSSVTCEVTGQRGTLCRPNQASPGGWLRTLSKDECKKTGYIPVDSKIADSWGIQPVQQPTNGAEKS